MKPKYNFTLCEKLVRGGHIALAFSYTCAIASLWLFEVLLLRGDFGYDRITVGFLIGAGVFYVPILIYMLRGLPKCWRDAMAVLPATAPTQDYVRCARTTSGTPRDAPNVPMSLYGPSKLSNFPTASFSFSESSFSAGCVHSHGTTRMSRRISPLPLHHLHFGSGSIQAAQELKHKKTGPRIRHGHSCA